MRLEREQPNNKFFDTLSKQNLKTFSHIAKRKIYTAGKSKEIVLKADRRLFGHMILIAESRQLNMHDVLAHPLGPLPWALANSDGSLRKTNKAALVRELEKPVSPAEIIHGPSACIIDGMSIVRKMNGNGKTFGQLADALLSVILNEGAQSQRIDMVFDVYRETSIKDAERCNRGSNSGIRFRNIAHAQKIQQWKNFLSCSSNKSDLIRFLVEQWQLPKSTSKLHGKSLYVTQGDNCYKITSYSCEDVAQLKCTQEEADTRILLHALHAAENGMHSVIISSEDTDVLVLCTAFSKTIPCSMYVKCGTVNRTRFADISKIANSIGEDACNALIGLHAFTGCDTVSAFSGRGKVHALKLMKKEQAYQLIFSELGQSWELSTVLFDKIEQFTCQMYISNTTITSVNDMRYQLFCLKRGEVESSQLPPCRDCLYMHTLRSNFQSAIWRRCLDSTPIVPDPIDHGWMKDEDGKIAIKWMQNPPAPDAVLHLLSCNCSRFCQLPSCTCLNNGLACTSMCKLQTCNNQKKADEEIGIELRESDDDGSEYASDEEEH